MFRTCENDASAHTNTHASKRTQAHDMWCVFWNICVPVHAVPSAKDRWNCVFHVRTFENILCTCLYRIPHVCLWCIGAQQTTSYRWGRRCRRCGETLLKFSPAFRVLKVCVCVFVWERNIWGIFAAYSWELFRTTDGLLLLLLARLIIDDSEWFVAVCVFASGMYCTYGPCSYAWLTFKEQDNRWCANMAAALGLRYEPSWNVSGSVLRMIPKKTYIDSYDSYDSCKRNRHMLLNMRPLSVNNEIVTVCDFIPERPIKYG